MRRNLRVGDDSAPSAGTISAGAEEPQFRRLCLARSGDYLRGCGGTDAVSGLISHIVGLSPRVRRNHLRKAATKAAKRTISAGAEEPYRAMISAISSKDYLRGCGGTAHRNTFALLL